MTARELWNSIGQGNSFAMLTASQRNYLIDLARQENIFDSTNTAVRFPDGLIVRIRNASQQVGAYGGGLVKKTIPGKFKAIQFYLIEFTDTKNTQFASDDEIASIKRQGFKYIVLKP